MLWTTADLATTPPRPRLLLPPRSSGIFTTLVPPYLTSEFLITYNKVIVYELWFHLILYATIFVQLILRFITLCFLLVNIIDKTFNLCLSFPCHHTLNITVDMPDCPRCDREVAETAVHAFYNCKWVRPFWSHVGAWIACIVVIGCWIKINN